MRTTFKNELIKKTGVIFVFVLTLLSAVSLFAQPYIGWIQRYNGPGNGDDKAVALAIDNSGNVYITGSSIGDTTGLDYCTIKYLPNGDTGWVRRYNNPAYKGDYTVALRLDKSGNVYVTGTSIGQGIMGGYGSTDIVTINISRTATQPG